MPNDIEKFNTKEVQDILGYIPKWIVRWGITLLFIILIVLLIGSWVVKYPDTVTGSITITTENPPAPIVARVGGKIENLFVENNQLVTTGDILASIDNPANINDIINLESLLDTFIIASSNIDNSSTAIFFSINNLGEVEPYYASFIKLLSGYYHFRKLDYHANKRISIKKQINKYNKLIAQLIKQKSILVEVVQLSHNQFKRDSTLFINDLISENELEESKSKLLTKQYSFNSAEVNFENTNLLLLQQKQLLMETNIDHQDDENNLIVALQKAKDDLISELLLWKQKYLLIAPISGKVTFTNFWSKNQNVNSGDIVVTVVPDTNSKIVGKIDLPIRRSGKVVINQNVNVKLDNYPYMEYGIIRGKIKLISLVPSENYYIVDVEFPNGLTTNYDIKLQFTQGMRGLAEIITADRKLIERIINPIKSIFENRVKN